jgi:hypothetical protein
MMQLKASKRLITMLVVLATMASGAAPISAQTMGGEGMGGAGAGGGKGHRGSQDQKADAKPKPKVDEKAYNSALTGIPDRKFDPWRGAR